MGAAGKIITLIKYLPKREKLQGNIKGQVEFDAEDYSIAK